MHAFGMHASSIYLFFIIVHVPSSLLYGIVKGRLYGTTVLLYETLLKEGFLATVQTCTPVTHAFFACTQVSSTRC